MTALWPDRIPLDYLRSTESAIGPTMWRTMYLSDPEPMRDVADRAVMAPKRGSFIDFLTNDAMVPGDASQQATRGTFRQYTFDGREALLDVSNVLDTILGGNGRKTISDASIALAGGAQFGKTLWEHSVVAYATGQLFRSVITFLPDEGLVKDLVQTKFRPNIVDQLPWFSDMIKLGVAVNESGKTVDRIGAFTVSDGIRRATGLFSGLNKIPTSVSGDIALLDEVDDVDPRNEKFVSGRLNASDLRLIIRVGTQRVHGRGMNRAWKEGSQGVVELLCEKCGHSQNPEESFPQIICRRGGGRLSHTGDLQEDGKTVADHRPENQYFLGCVKCGAELDRSKPIWMHKKPERIGLNKWSFRVSQLSIGSAIDLNRIVKDWNEALEDETKMLVFRTDVLGIPKSSAQKLDPDIVDRARRIEVYDGPGTYNERKPRYGGLDMGGKCWFTVREVESPECKRIIYAESIPLHQVGERVPKMFHALNLTSILIDQMPETKESRNLALAINGLNTSIRWPRIPDSGPCHVSFHGGLTYVRTDQGDEKWVGMKAGVVRFDHKRLGKGVTQSIDVFTGPTGLDLCVPLIICNRYESVDRVVREFLTPQEGEWDSTSAGLRTLPAIRLPRKQGDLWQVFDDHHIAGSEREYDENQQLGDYVDAIPNHFLFANAYSALGEIIGGRSKAQRFVAGRIGGGESARGGV